MATYQVIILLVLFTTGLIAYPQGIHFDPIDLCLITCDDCYKGSTAVECANECLMAGGKVRGKWSVTCPLFNLPIFRLNQQSI